MNNIITGKLTNSTPVAVGVGVLSCPFTATLNSSAAGRKIELSTNGGAEYFTPQPDLPTSPTMQMLTVNAPVSHVRFTGQANDTWSLL